MRSLGDLIQSQPRKVADDEKTVLVAFDRMMERQYGAVGRRKVKAKRFIKGLLVCETQSSNWASEIWSNRSSVIESVNEEIGGTVVSRIKIGT